MSVFSSKKISCGICEKEFFVQPARIKSGRGKYCSKECYFLSKKGKTPWNKGIPATWATGGKHHKWKGNDVGYHGLHEWVYKQLGAPMECVHCGKIGETSYQIQWANKSGNYLRDTSDWIRLCVKCHRAYDKR